MKKIFYAPDNTDLSKLENWADYIVVGAGAAGSVVAARLAEGSNNKILVIELGPDNLGDPRIDDPKDATLLWENPDGPNPSPTSLEFETTMQYSRKYKYPRGNGSGGSTNHHSLFDGRGSQKIYDNIASLVGDQRWSYKSILPYYKKMESYLSPTVDTNYHGVSGWLKVINTDISHPIHQAFLKSAHKVTKAPIQTDMNGNPANTNGVGALDVQVGADGKRSYAFKDLFMPQLEKSDNLFIIYNTLVTKVIIESAESLKAMGVECINHVHAYLADKSLNNNSIEVEPKIISLKARKEVILSGGAINTPQLLMLSGIGPKEHLEKFSIPVLVDLSGVGSDLMDHHEVNVIFEIDPEKSVWPTQAANIIKQIDNLEESLVTPKLKSIKQNIQKFAGTNSGAVILDWYSGVESDIEHDLHISTGESFFYDFDFASLDPLPDGKLRVDYARSQYNIFHKDFLRVFNHVLIEVLRPSDSSGTIRLISADPTVPPAIDLALYKDDLAQERMAKGILMIREIFKDANLKQYYKLDSDGAALELFPGKQFSTLNQLKDYVGKWSAIGHHISGTAKMGKPDNKRAVIDSSLRVLGIVGLRIVDTSIYPYPYLHGYNTSRGAYLIGEVAADIIKSEK